ncbi:MAG: hypothetical protein HY834_01840 [Devosia nanyangense]|uniref:Uncharacterized protein n=1 Tax=Devosia nanyangense TaxID=1228055 RepID=A0A933L0F5_9HYPH|nr:hypothetical protein [Devosia nanyangense]
MTTPAAAVPHKRDGHSIGYNLGAIAVVAALCGLGLAYAIDAAGRQGRAAVGASSTMVRTLGGKDLEIPASWFRAGQNDGTGFAKQVDLFVSLPLGPDGAARRIDVTLMPRSRVRPSASLLDGVYLHEFMPEQLSGPPGLIGKPLVAREGYENETVWYDALSSSPFVAKCSAPVAEGQPGRCLRAVYLGPGIAAVYGFDVDVLGNWKTFDAEIRPLLAQIGAL